MSGRDSIKYKEIWLKLEKKTMIYLLKKAFLPKFGNFLLQFLVIMVLISGIMWIN